MRRERKTVAQRPAVAAASALLLMAGAAAAQDGAALFAERCAACHGTLPDVPSAPALGGLDARDFREAINEHGDAEGLVEGLSEREIEALHAALAKRAD